MTKAMVLAAGKGTRLRPLTNDLPKPMIPILGKPILEYLIEHLASHGINQIMINVAYDHKIIESYFSDGRKWGVEIGYSYEGELMDGRLIPYPIGSAGGIKKIQDFSEFFDDTTIVICGDALIDLDITEAIKKHKENNAIASVITIEVPKDKVINYGIVVTNPSGLVESFQEKPLPENAKSNQASTGIYIFEPEVINLIPTNEIYDIGMQLFPKLVENKHLFFAQKCFFNWNDIGKIDDYWLTFQELLSESPLSIKPNAKEVRPGVWVGINVKINLDKVSINGPVYIGSSTSIEDGVTIAGPAWIGHGSKICSNSTIERCIIFEYTKIEENQFLSDKIITSNYCIEKTGDYQQRIAGNTELKWGDSRASV